MGLLFSIWILLERKELKLIDWLDKAKKNDLMVDKLEDNNEQTLLFGENDDRFTWLIMDMRLLRSSIFE